MDKTILGWFDSPCQETGFAQVAKQVCGSLHKEGYKLRIAGKNHNFGYYSREKFPYEIWSTTSSDMHNYKSMVSLATAGGYDYLLMVDDINVIENGIAKIERATELRFPAYKKLKGFKWIVSIPVDAPNLTADAIRNIRYADQIILWTYWAEKKFLEICPECKGKTRVISLATDTETMKPLENKKELRKLYGIREKQWVILSTNRNQWRKDLGRLMMVVRDLEKARPDIKPLLWLHCDPNDIGGSLQVIAQQVGIKPKNLKLSSTNTISREQLNEIYNCADVTASCSIGEGWGFQVTESFACKIPTIIGKNTVNPELIGDNEERGYLVNNKDDMISYTDSEYVRQFVDKEEFTQKLIDMHDNEEETKKKVEIGYKWVKIRNNEEINKKWLKLFKEI